MWRWFGGSIGASRVHFGDNLVYLSYQKRPHDGDEYLLLNSSKNPIIHGFSGDFSQKSSIFIHHHRAPFNQIKSTSYYPQNGLYRVQSTPQTPATIQKSTRKIQPSIPIPKQNSLFFTSLLQENILQYTHPHFPNTHNFRLTES